MAMFPYGYLSVLLLCRVRKQLFVCLSAAESMPLCCINLMLVFILKETYSGSSAGDTFILQEKNLLR